MLVKVKNHDNLKLRIFLMIGLTIILFIITNYISQQQEIQSNDQDIILFRKQSNIMNSLQSELIHNEIYPCIHDHILQEESKLQTPDEYYADVYKQQQQDNSQQGQLNADAINGDDRVNEEIYKLTEQKEMKPIRIHFDYSNLQESEEDVKHFIKHELIPAAGEFFKEFLKVKPIEGRIRVDPYYRFHKCGAARINIPKEHIDTGIEADIIFYISAQSDSKENFLAYASTCHQSSRYSLSSGRPIIGYFNMNLFYLSKHVRDVDPMRKSQWIWTTIHEMTHSLVFSPNHFRKFVKYNNPTTSDSSFTYVNAQPILKLVQEHFGCQNVKGAPLENEGGQGTAGAHWERKIFGNELMTGSAMYDSIISEFTGQVFQISGWYDVDMSKTSVLTWGRKKGCAFLNKQDDCDSDLFCETDNKEINCSYDYGGLGSCQKDPLSDSCNYNMSYSNTHCNYPPKQIQKFFQKLGGADGAHSRCWKTDLVQKKAKKKVNAMCFESKCDYSDKNNPIAYLKYDKEWIKCQKNKSRVQSNDGYFNFYCPDSIYNFCHSLSACPDSCSARGTCNNGICHCFKGFKGENCAQSEN